MEFDVYVWFYDDWRRDGEVLMEIEMNWKSSRILEMRLLCVLS